MIISKNPMTEFDFIRTYLQRREDRDVLLGIGDDAAIVRPRPGFDLCFSSDMLLSDRHFFADVSAADLAYKVVAVNVSDMAAMGALPRWVLLSAALPELDKAWLDSFCNSLFAQLDRYGITLIGGDTTKGALAFNMTIIGEVPQNQGLKRSAAQAGDDIWVSGQIGMAAAGLDGCLGKAVLPEAVWQACKKRLLRPDPRVALGSALLPLAHAAQDVSDGLAQDLQHILTASGVGAELWADRIPAPQALRESSDKEQLYAWQLGGGDDYELLFTAPQSVRALIEVAAKEAATPVTRVGRIAEGSVLHIMDDAGNAVRLTKSGFDHFG